MLTLDLESIRLIKKYLKELRLPTILDYYEEQGQEAIAENFSYEEYLLGLYRGNGKRGGPTESV